MEKNVPTIYKSLLQLAQLTKSPYEVLPFSTMNQKLNIQASAQLNPGEIPGLKVACIGIGGLKVQTGTDGTTFSQSYRHKPTDSGLFQELPFLVRPVSSDISANLRANYRLRKLITDGEGNNFFAYYGKVLDFGTNTTQLQKRTNQTDGTDSVVPYVPGAQDLSPSPTILTSGQTVTTTGQYVTAARQLDFRLSPQDVIEILNASQVVYGDTDHALITELALCSCVDRELTVTVGGVQVTYTEAIATQVMNFLSTNFPASSWGNGVEWGFDIGNSEPLLATP